MEAIEKVKRALEQAGFSKAELKGLETIGNGSRKVAGFIVSERFKAKSPSERQDMIWTVFETGLDAKDRQRVTAILTMTPEELSDYQDNGDIKPEKPRRAGSKAVGVNRTRVQAARSRKDTRAAVGKRASAKGKAVIKKGRGHSKAPKKSAR